MSSSLLAFHIALFASQCSDFDAAKRIKLQFSPFSLSPLSSALVDNTSLPLANSIDMSRAPSTPPARQYAPNEIPSPFLASGLAAPRAPLQPSDLYGAKLKATLNHVKSETAAMRSDIEGVLQIRDELDSLRNELTIVRQLVDTQGM